MRRIVVLAAVLAAVVALGACRQTDREAGGQLRPAPRATEAWFSDATESSGLRMTHFNGMAGDFLYPEVMAPGVALFDYDNDGDLDVFVPQGRMLGNKTLDQALVKPEQPLRGHLFRNDLVNVGRTLSGPPAPGRADKPGPTPVPFTDVTDASGITQTSYGMGAAAGDFDNDGCVDLYVTALGAN